MVEMGSRLTVSPFHPTGVFPFHPTVHAFPPGLFPLVIISGHSNPIVDIAAYELSEATQPPQQLKPCWPLWPIGLCVGEYHLFDFVLVVIARVQPREVFIVPLIARGAPYKGGYQKNDNISFLPVVQHPVHFVAWGDNAHIVFLEFSRQDTYQPSVFRKVFVKHFVDLFTGGTKRLC